MFTRIVTVFICIVIALLIGFHFTPTPEYSRGSSQGKVAIGGPFTLIDQRGNTVSETDFRGKLMLVYFGYTFCPDICHIGVAAMDHAINDLGDQAEKIAPIFITFDPKRDTLNVMQEYASRYSDRLIALTGSQDAIDEAVKSYRIYHAKSAATEDDAFYLLDHSSFIYLMDTDGEYLAHFPHSASPKTIITAIKKYL
jgi:protein SCO1/2